MKKTLISTLAIGSLLFGANAARGATLVIDNFTDPGPSLEVGDDLGVDFAFGTVPLPPLPVTGQIIGGQRTLTLSTPPLTGAEGNVKANVNAVEQRFTQETDRDRFLYNTVTTLIWNGSGGSGLNQLFSFPDSGRYGFRLSSLDLFNRAASTGTIATVTLELSNSSADPIAPPDPSNPLGSLNPIPSPFARLSRNFETVNIPASETDPDRLELTYFRFSNFSSTNGFSFGAPVNEIRLIVESTVPGLEFSIGALTAEDLPLPPTPPPTGVPEPSTGLACLALVGGRFAWLGWKKLAKNRERS